MVRAGIDSGGRLASRAVSKQATRQALVAAARDLFVCRGFDSVTVDDIVAAAGVSQRTFFRYFPSKMDAAFPNHYERVRVLVGLLAAHRDPERPLLGVRSALAEYVKYYAKSRDDLLAEFRYVLASKDLAARDADNDGHYEAAIVEALARAGLSGHRAGVLGGVIFGGIRATVFEWFSGGCRGDLRRLSGELLAVLERLADDEPGTRARRRPRARSGGNG